MEFAVSESVKFRREFKSDLRDLFGRPSQSIMSEKGETLTKLFLGLKSLAEKPTSASLQDVLNPPETGIRVLLGKIAYRLDRVGCEEGIDEFPFETIEKIVMTALRKHAETHKSEWKGIVISGIECLRLVVILTDEVYLERIMCESFLPALLIYQDPSGPYFEFGEWMIELVGQLMRVSSTSFEFFREKGFFEYIEAFTQRTSSARALLASLFAIPSEMSQAVVPFLNAFLTCDDQIMHRYGLRGFSIILGKFGQIIDVSIPLNVLPAFLADLADNLRVNEALTFASSLETPPDIFPQLVPIANDFCEYITHRNLAKCLTKFASSWKELMTDELLSLFCQFAQNEPYESAVACVWVLWSYASYGQNIELDSQIARIYVDFMSDADVGLICIEGLRQIFFSAPGNTDGLSEALELALPNLTELLSSEDTPEVLRLAAQVFIRSLDIGKWLERENM